MGSSDSVFSFSSKRLESYSTQPMPSKALIEAFERLLEQKTTLVTMIQRESWSGLY